MFHVASKILKEISFTYSQLPTDTRIVQYPFGNAAFSILLDKAFVDSGLDSQRFPELTSHKGLNVVLLPLWTVLLRMRGVRLINFHWITGPWQPPGANTRLRKSILWAFVSSTILGDNMDMATGDSILFSFNLLADTTIVVSWV